jgi:hypothetical protein
VPPEPTPYVSSARGVRQFGFAERSRDYLRPKILTLQRLRYYDDDMVDLTGSSNATGHMFLSLIFIYALFFPFHMYVYVLFIIINYIYVIMFNYFLD